MGEFDWFKSFLDIDLGKVEAYSELIGRVTGALFNGMVDAGMQERDAHRVIATTIKTILTTTVNIRPE